MSAEEILEWLLEHDIDGDTAWGTIFGTDTHLTEVLYRYPAKEIVEKIETYECNNKNSEEDVVWIYRTLCIGDSSAALVKTEREAIEWCEKKLHAYPGSFTTYEPICVNKDNTMKVDLGKNGWFI